MGDQTLSALVRTSVFGYSERLEGQSDEFAFSYLEKRYGNVEAYQSLMQRLRASPFQRPWLPDLLRQCQAH